MNLRKQIIFAKLVKLCEKINTGEITRDDAVAQLKKLIPTKEERAEWVQMLSNELSRRLKEQLPKLYSSSSTEMLEALMHGISKETYLHNKTLPLEDKVKLPVWEAIYSLNYKEKVHGGQK